MKKRTTPLSKAQITLKNNHISQVNWLENQIAKGNDSIFLNSKNAIVAYTKLVNKHTGLVPDSEIEYFMASRLTESAMKKLITTLRVAETRSKADFTLQVSISQRNRMNLERLASQTGMKRNEIINKLLELATVSKISKSEEQLEITL